MKPEFSGIERRLDELNERLNRLEPLKNKNLNEFLQDAYLRDIVERNLEVMAQCCKVFHWTLLSNNTFKGALAMRTAGDSWGLSVTTTTATA